MHLNLHENYWSKNTHTGAEENWPDRYWSTGEDDRWNWRWVPDCKEGESRSGGNLSETERLDIVLNRSIGNLEEYFVSFVFLLYPVSWHQCLTLSGEISSLKADRQMSQKQGCGANKDFADEFESMRRKNCEYRLKINALETELIREAEPLKKKLVDCMFYCSHSNVRENIILNSCCSVVNPLDPATFRHNIYSIQKLVWC